MCSVESTERESVERKDSGDEQLFSWPWREALVLLSRTPLTRSSSLKTIAKYCEIGTACYIEVRLLTGQRAQDDARLGINSKTPPLLMPNTKSPSDCAMFKHIGFEKYEDFRRLYERTGDQTASL